MDKIDVIAAGHLPARTASALAEAFTVHRLNHGEAIPPAAANARGIARGGHFAIDGAMIESLPRLEIIANFGVGYDGIDLVTSAARGIVVTNTPDVLTEEVADTALGLMLMTVRELSAAERHLRAGRWPSEGPPPLSRATMRDRTVGIVGLGRIGIALGRRLVAMQVPVVYHNRSRRDDVPYRHYADLAEMAAAVDTLVSVLPGGRHTEKIIDAVVFKALGPRGIFINVGRGSVVDEPALIAALKDGTILSAGLDVFAHEPNVPAELMALPNAVLLPHVGSASVYTRDAMGQLCVDNLLSWFTAGKPLTPVPETPWQAKA